MVLGPENVNTEGSTCLGEDDVEFWTCGIWVVTGMSRKELQWAGAVDCEGWELRQNTGSEEGREGLQYGVGHEP